MVGRSGHWVSAGQYDSVLDALVRSAMTVEQDRCISGAPL